MNSKYEISTKENREFLKASCEELLNFGHRFLHQMEVPIIWGRRNTMEGQKSGNLDHLSYGSCIQSGSDAWP